MNVITLAYHDIVPSRTLSSDNVRVAATAYTLELATFQGHLDAICRSAGADAVTAIGARRATRSRMPVLLTFDDGGEGAITCAADALEAKGWRGHFLITTNWIGCRGFLSSPQLRQLHARGHILGSHTVSHPHRMSVLPYRKLLAEWTTSCSVLADILGCRIEVASVADGYYSSKVGDAAAEAGLKYLFTSEPLTRVSHRGDCRILGRYAVQSGMTADECAGIARGASWPRFRQATYWNVKKACKHLLGEQYLHLRRQLLARHAR